MKIDLNFKELLLTLAREALQGIREGNNAIVFQRLSQIEDYLVNS